MENKDALMPYCGVHYLGLQSCCTACLFFYFSNTLNLIRSHPSLFSVCLSAAPLAADATAAPAGGTGMGKKKVGKKAKKKKGRKN